MLNANQIAQFERDGFLVIDHVIDPDRIIAPIRAEYAALLDDLYSKWFSQGKVTVDPVGLSFEDKLIIAYRAGCDWFQPMDISLPGDRIQHDTPMHFGQAVFDLVTDKHLLDVVESLIGGELISNPIQHVRIKPPAKTLQADEVRAHVGGTAWHQDRAVAHEEADTTQMVTVWCAITDATTENGCLQAIPRHPGDAMRPHCPQRQTAIAPGYLDESEAVPLPVKAGGIVLLHPLTPHASLDNTSDSIRWSFDLRYNVTGQPTGRSHFPSFVARSRRYPASEMRSAETWRTLWEEARDRLAEQPHIDIHRWSADAPACA
ncbi:MAG: phytanoyl-CoA dioxygenase family protein [Pseudomonadota bacterium]